MSSLTITSIFIIMMKLIEIDSTDRERVKDDWSRECNL